MCSSWLLSLPHCLACCGLTRDELTAAAVRRPDAAVVVAPGLPEKARRGAGRSDERHAVGSLGRTILALAFLRFAKDGVLCGRRRLRVRSGPVGACAFARPATIGMRKVAKSSTRGHPSDHVQGDLHVVEFTTDRIRLLLHLRRIVLQRAWLTAFARFFCRFSGLGLRSRRPALRLRARSVLGCDEVHISSASWPMRCSGRRGRSSFRPAAVPAAAPAGTVAVTRYRTTYMLFLADGGLVADEQVRGVRVGLGQSFLRELRVTTADSPPAGRPDRRSCVAPLMTTHL